MPTMTTSGRDTRSSRSPSAAATTRPPSALCPPSSQISQPGGAWSTSAPDASRCIRAGHSALTMPASNAALSIFKVSSARSVAMASPALSN